MPAAPQISVTKRIIFSFIPLLTILLAGEFVCRVKFFLLHDHDWNYITAPFVVQDTAGMDHGMTVAPVQTQVRWHKPCRDREVFSARAGRNLPYTYDDNCFRGDRVTQQKGLNEYRVFVVGGSTVEGQQPDAETFTTRIKENLPARVGNKRVLVVNAGHSGYGSTEILKLYPKVRAFHPDLVLYYEAWHEQIEYSQFAQIDQFIGAATSRLHDLLHYRSMLYTYAVEKYAFMTQKSHRFWIINRERLASNLRRLRDAVERDGSEFVFVTQASMLPRRHKGIDTFDAAAIVDLLTRLKENPSYGYDVAEISALNQRLAVLDGIAVFEGRNGVVNIMPELEALGPERRRQLFSDLQHMTPDGDEWIGARVGTAVTAFLAASMHAPSTAP